MLGSAFRYSDANGATPAAALLFFDLVTRPSAPSSVAPSIVTATRIRALVDDHFNFVWRYLRGLGVPEAHIDDAAQQVFVVAAQKIADIDVGSERSFLVGTAHGVAANARRTSARRREVNDESRIDVAMDTGPDPEQRIASKEGLAILDRFLDHLPADLREVFILFELEGMTMAEMATALHLPPGTVASKLRRAREEFQEMVKRFQATRPRGRVS